MEIQESRGGAYVKFPPWWGAHIFWKVHILDTLRNKDHLSEATVNQTTEKNELIILQQQKHQSKHFN